MTPESEDNYGGNFCSILCLKTTPTIVLLATENGIIHHCIVLDDDDKQLDFEVRSLSIHISKVRNQIVEGI